MHTLIEQWRREATEDFGGITGPREEFVIKTLLACADELERAWHDEQHAMNLQRGSTSRRPALCAICRKEMEEEK